MNTDVNFQTVSLEYSGEYGHNIMDNVIIINVQWYNKDIQHKIHSGIQCLPFNSRHCQITNVFVDH